MRRSEWCGKNLSVYHLSFGEVVFGQPRKATHLMSRRESRAYEQYRTIRGWIE